MYSIGSDSAIFLIVLQCIFTFPYTEGWRRSNNCQECGIFSSSLSYRVVGGDDVPSPRKYPWMVSLSSRDSKNSERIMCGGALISSLFVLTAAHCLMNEDSRRADRCDPPGHCYRLASEVVLHAWPNSTYGRRLPVDRLIPHPDFKFDARELTHDIALVKLKFAVRCKALLSPICLPDHDLSNIGGRLTVAGWGDTSGHEPDTVQLLKEGTVTQIDSHRCLNKGQSTAPARQILCTLSRNTGQVGCYGDSGSPVFGLHEGSYYSLGVTVDHTSKTCDPGEPMIYTKVYAYWGWIKRHVRRLPSPRKAFFYF